MYYTAQSDAHDSYTPNLDYFTDRTTGAIAAAKININQYTTSNYYVKSGTFSVKGATPGMSGSWSDTTSKYTVTATAPAPVDNGAQTAGWVSTVSKSAGSSGTWTIDKATFTTSGKTVKSSTAGYIPANATVATFSDAAFEFNGNQCRTTLYGGGYIASNTVAATMSNATFYVSADSFYSNAGGYVQGDIYIGSVGAATITSNNVTVAPNVLSGSWNSSTNKYVVSQSAKSGAGTTSITINQEGYIASWKGTQNNGSITISAPTNLTIDKATFGVSGNTVTSTGAGYVPAGETVGTVGAGTISAQSSTMSSTAYIDPTLTWNTSSEMFVFGGTKTVSATALATTSGGYLTSSATDTKSMSTTVYAEGSVDQVGLGVTQTGSTRVTPSISRKSKPSTDTWTDAASGAATTYKPTSGPYVSVGSNAVTTTLVATPKVTSAGYSDGTHYGATAGSYTVGAYASSNAYVPIKQTSVQYSLPSGYQQVEYLLNTSTTQYIITNIYCGANTDIEIKALKAASYSIFGAGPYSFGLTGHESDDYFYLNSTQLGRHTHLAYPSIYAIKGNNLIVNENSTTITRPSSGYSSYPLALFARTWNATTADDIGVNQRIYYVKIWQSGVLSNLLIPVRQNSSLKYGLYDLITGTFYQSSGSGSFSGGATMSNSNFAYWDEGWMSAGVITASDVTYGSSTKTSNGTYDVTNLKQVIVSFPTYDGSIT